MLHHEIIQLLDHIHHYSLDNYLKCTSNPLTLEKRFSKVQFDLCKYHWSMNQCLYNQCYKCTQLHLCLDHVNRWHRNDIHRSSLDNYLNSMKKKVLIWKKIQILNITCADDIGICASICVTCFARALNCIRWLSMWTVSVWITATVIHLARLLIKIDNVKETLKHHFLPFQTTV